MKYPSIRIEGSILSADILDKIEHSELLGQKPKDFGFDGSNVRVKDEIVKAWADAQDMWRIYKRKMEDLDDSKAGTTETRNFWIVPLLGLLGYDIELYRRAQEIHDKTYAISHFSNNIDHFPIHIMGFRDSLDKKRQDSGPRMSPHALVQEYINLNEHLYALVSNGITLRLLRDSSRLIKLSFLEFDLERMFEEEHFSDFALMFRLIHSSRMPVKQTESPESLIEGYHQDSLDSGSRIREGLSEAVERSIISISNGFLSHPDNHELRSEIIDEKLAAKEFYQYQLRFIYRILFLMVIEERDLIFTKDTPTAKRDIYNKYYSVGRIRKMSEKRYLADKKQSDIWVGLKNTFRLFESSKYGEMLDIKPLAGDLFDYDAILHLNRCNLNNKVLLECVKNLSVFTNPETGQKMRVNYASLNVEEFGSVYEGLLEYDPELVINGDRVEFKFIAGEERSTSGSHYTPDELVQPLIKHSLEYIIEYKLKQSNPEEALLSITVCDVACGSGHILLSAARRIATELSKIRTGEDQPSPSAFREAVRDVIRHCIYGVDLNPLAVELAKVALWLEAHNPGEPLNFLDHKIKCGDAIVGLAHMEELEDGIATEAFKKLPGDDDTARTLAQRNKTEKETSQRVIDFDEHVGQKINEVNTVHNQFTEMPETTPEEIEAKERAYETLITGENWQRLKTLADIKTAQFFIPKTVENREKLITDGIYRNMLASNSLSEESATISKANTVAGEKRFFHWFLEFPEVFASGGFNCILGNPPYLGGKKINESYGNDYKLYLSWNFQGTGGQADLVTYFIREIFHLIGQDGFLGLITTNTISQGDTREGGLEYILDYGQINFASPSIKWPGIAVVTVTIISIIKGEFKGDKILNGNYVQNIDSYLDSDLGLGNPFKLIMNQNKSFEGIKIYGGGFIISLEEVNSLINKDYKNKDVIFPYLSGEDVNKRPNQSPSRHVINFFDWSMNKASTYKDCFEILNQKVKPKREDQNDLSAKEKWWLYQRRRPVMTKAISKFNKVMVISKHTKYLTFVFVENNAIITNGIIVITLNSWMRFSIMHSAVNEHWSWKYASTMGNTTIRYTPNDVFETFPFPQNLSTETEAELEQIGETYHEFRRQLMLKIQLGLTKTYNQFHNPDLAVVAAGLSAAEVEKQYGKETKNIWNHLNRTDDVCSIKDAVHDIKHLRQLHKEMDEMVLKAYGWDDLDLAHDFYEVDYLPENDRVRYTISPKARKEVLKRLLLLNHEIYEEENKQGLHGKKKTEKKAAPKVKKIENEKQETLFAAEPPVPNTPKLKPMVMKESLFSGSSLENEFQPGHDVYHAHFGEGQVTSVDGSGESAKITVKFKKGDTKILAAKFANLKRYKRVT